MDFKDNGTQKTHPPRIGSFYYYQGEIIAPSSYQKQIDPVTRIITPDIRLNNPGEHRDMWDEYIALNYPEIIALYDDNHKWLPRGRVGIYNDTSRLRFLITLDKCIQGREAKIIGLYNLNGYDIVFSYGTLNYLCRDCLGSASR
jgi:hypothetical protein